MFLGCADEVATKLGSGGLRRHGLGLEDLRVSTDTSSIAVALQKIEQAALAVDVVVGQIELGDSWAGQAQPMFGGIP